MMSDSGALQAAEDSAEFVEFLGDLVISLEQLRSGNRILTLKPQSYVTIISGLRHVSAMARTFGLRDLTDRSNTLLALLRDASDTGFVGQESYLVVQSFAEFLQEAHRVMKKDIARLSDQPMRLEDRARMCVLCVDDEEIEIEILSRAFEADAEVLAATDVTEAVRVLSERKPDLILLDVNLGALSGTDLLALLQKAVKLRKIPVIMRSNLYDDATVTAGLLGGAVDFIPKSVAIQELKRRALEVMQNGRPRLYSGTG